MSPDLDRVVADVAKSLNKARVPYMIIGGVANAIWGSTRHYGYRHQRVRVEFAFGMATYVHRAVERAVEIISERQKDRDDVVGIFIHRRAALDREYLDPRVHELAVVLERPEIEERYRELVEGK